MAAVRVGEGGGFMAAVNVSCERVRGHGRCERVRGAWEL